MRRGGIPYDQLQKTNMYADGNADPNNNEAGHNDRDGVAGKKKKKGRKRPKNTVAVDQQHLSASMNVDGNNMDESMRSN